MRRSGTLLALSGVIGLLFFWLTDPRYGVPGYMRVWESSNINYIDACNAAIAGTIVGMAGSAAVLFTGLWLMSRRAL